MLIFTTIFSWAYNRNSGKMREVPLMVLLDMNSRRNDRNFTGESAFMIFVSRFYYFMEFSNVLSASSKGKMYIKEQEWLLSQAACDQISYNGKKKENNKMKWSGKKKDTG